MGVATAMGSRERLPRQKASCCGAVTMHLALNWYRLTQALHQRDPDAAEQRIGTDEVHADGRGPSPLKQNAKDGPASCPRNSFWSIRLMERVSSWPGVPNTLSISR